MKHYVCECCGRDFVVRPSPKRRFCSRSCNSKTINTIHGHSGLSPTRTYLCWKNMIQRCTNPRTRKWPIYGGRGIKVCKRWASFANFLLDMGESPDGKSLDRFPDKDGNYEKANCRWATPTEQALNTRVNVHITFKGKTKTLTEWARELGMGRKTLEGRIKRFGWKVEDALTIPVGGAK